MQIENSKILILGGFGLVGSAICRRLMKKSPATIFIASLKKEEAETACELMRNEWHKQDPNMFVPKWGNLFTRTEWKDVPFGEIIGSEKTRVEHIKDVFNDLDGEMLRRSYLYELIMECKPDLIIDCMNTATGIAYLDIYNSTITALKEIENNNLTQSTSEIVMASSYIPQLTRHIQILSQALLDASPKMYFKVGTTGTGGMGLNIPYTHSEERPSKVLLAKTAVGGAHTLLLYLLARTPAAPIIKEIKPAATIAWKRIAYGEVKRKGRNIPLVDMDYDKARNTEGNFVFADRTDIVDTGNAYKSVFVDTGENGLFSRGEFEAISALGQMEMVTPEEIADYLVYEVQGGNTGYEVISGLDATTLGPSYRAGLMRQTALDTVKKMEKENKCESVAFEMLGPPRLSKLLFEGYLIRKIAGSMNAFMAMSPIDISAKATEIVKNDTELRQQMLSVGLVVLLPDGKKYLRGNDVKVPVQRANTELPLTKENIDKWCYEGWVDLRESGWKEWKGRIKSIIDQAYHINGDMTGSRYFYTPEHWDNFEKFDEGKIVGWVFEFEDEGARWKR
ncbi:MAG: short-chain dehydrogenase [Ignavibacteria bacterium]|jgi:hypothetical protein|nr:short-chain dehydrogenase [Ignavibacteria bacterium]